MLSVGNVPVNRERVLNGGVDDVQRKGGAREVRVGERVELVVQELSSKGVDENDPRVGPGAVENPHVHLGVGGVDAAVDEVVVGTVLVDGSQEREQREVEQGEHEVSPLPGKGPCDGCLVQGDQEPAEEHVDVTDDDEQPLGQGASFGLVFSLNEQVGAHHEQEEEDVRRVLFPDMLDVNVAKGHGEVQHQSTKVKERMDRQRLWGVGGGVRIC